VNKRFGGDLKVKKKERDQGGAARERASKGSGNVRWVKVSGRVELRLRRKHEK